MSCLFFCYVKQQAEVFPFKPTQSDHFQYDTQDMATPLATMNRRVSIMPTITFKLFAFIGEPYIMFSWFAFLIVIDHFKPNYPVGLCWGGEGFNRLPQHTS